MKAAILHLVAQGREVSLKKLRKQAIEDIGGDAHSSDLKELFDTALEALTEKGKVLLNNKTVYLVEADEKEGGEGKDDKSEKKKKKEKKEKKEKDEEEEGGKSEKSEKKRKHVDFDDNDNDKASQDASNADTTTNNGNKNNKKQKDNGKEEKDPKYKELWRTGEQMWRDGTFDDWYLTSNPDNITRLFCGNLNKKVTEEDLKSCIEGITYIKWITDKTTGEFYGSSFIEMKDARAAIAAVAKDKQKFMGRPLKIYYCPPRPGDTWPPRGGGGASERSRSEFGGGGAGVGPGGKTSSGNPPRRERTPKPPGCKKLYMGNLSYNIDDDTIVDFFKDCGTMVGLRWLTHKGTEEFRGCGFVEFSHTDEADRAIKLDGKELLGRPIKLDYTE